MAAKKGNLYAIGNNGGRPPKYETPELLFAKIAEYIDFEDNNSGDRKEGKGKYTLEGCALYLGFCSVQSMYDYEKKEGLNAEEFSYVIKRFKLWMQDYHVKGLRWGGTMMGSMFWLKNKSDYKDESTQHQNQNLLITTVTPQVIDTKQSLSSDESQIEM